MKVRCIKTNLYDVRIEGAIQRLEKYIHLSDGQLNLELNVDYTVYGIIFRDNSPWYYLCLDEDDEYPKPFAGEFFQVLDTRLSAYWSLSSQLMQNGGIQSQLVFKEWSEDSTFYERLVEGDPKAIELFRKYRSLMDREYST